MEFSFKRSYRGPVKAVILDWAGTAVDYGCCAPVAVFVEIYRKRGIEITLAQAREPMGLEKKDHIRAIGRQPGVAGQWHSKYGGEIGDSDIAEMFQDSIGMMVDCVADYAQPIPGVLETMAWLRQNNIKTGSGTGYTRPIMDRLVPVAEKFGYRPDVIVCPSDVPAGRPFPWMMYRNLIELGVYPIEAVVKVGDTLPDIEEGLNAGCWTVVVTKTGNELGLTETEVSEMDNTELTKKLASIEEKFWKAGAHYVIESVAALPPVIEEIQNRLRRGERP